MSTIGKEVTKKRLSRKLRDIGRAIRAPFNYRDALQKFSAYHTKEHTIDELVDFALSLKTSGFYRIDMVQIREEILALAEAVNAIKPKTILEIGTKNGGSLLLWSNIASERVITCDLSSSRYRNNLYQQFTPHNSNCEIITLQGDSHDKSFKQTVIDTLDGKPVDFLFIDGDHTEAGVESDYNDYKDLVRPGGIIAFHDIVEKQPTPLNQVYYFWQRIKKQAHTEEFVRDHKQTGFGIGIIRVD